jgi:hypothetical protein
MKKTVIFSIFVFLFFTACKPVYTEDQQTRAALVVLNGTITTSKGDTFPLLNAIKFWIESNDWKFVGWDCGTRFHKTWGKGVSVGIVWKNHKGETEFADWILDEKGEAHAINDYALGFGKVHVDKVAALKILHAKGN